MTTVRWILHESGWLMPTNGAPSARLDIDLGGGRSLTHASITWTRNKALVFEFEDGQNQFVPVSVLEELVWRAQRWHWRPSATTAATTGRHK